MSTAEALATLAPRFADRTALVFASGSSLTKLWCPDRPITLPSISVSDAWRIAPSADITHASDGYWWRHYQSLPEYAGLKTGINDGSGLPKGVLRLEVSGTSGYDPRLGYVRHGHNSGTAAAHLAAQLGAQRVVLVGFDMQGGHWFGEHPPAVRRKTESPFAQWMDHFAALGEALKPYGVEIVNATPDSAMTCFPFVDLEDECRAPS